MKVVIEIDASLPEDEVIIRCRKIDASIALLQQKILTEGEVPLSLVFYKNDEEYYFPLNDILFFQTENDAVWAHTTKEAYMTRHRLRELEDLLPSSFVRVSKSCIVNTAWVVSIKRNLTSSSLVRFSSSHKQIYVSRLYYQTLHQRMTERNRT